MSFKEKIIELLEKNMSERGFKLWKGINGLLPDTWDRPTSSTGKYHQKFSGRVPDQAEHVYEMLYGAVKLFRMFNFEPRSSNADTILMAIALHDSLKYGKFGSRKHTDYDHDKNAGDMIRGNKQTFLKLLTEQQFEQMEEAVRFHSGRWSTDIRDQQDKFDWHDYHPMTFFVHILDMMSTADLIQTDVREVYDSSIGKTGS